MTAICGQQYMDGKTGALSTRMLKKLAGTAAKLATKQTLLFVGFTYHQLLMRAAAL